MTRDLQKRIYENKVAKGFNTTDAYMEFCYLQVELAEAIQAYGKKLPNLGEELADVAIYLLGLAEILDIDLEKEIHSKVEINEKRMYETRDGVLTRVSDQCHGDIKNDSFVVFMRAGEVSPKTSMREFGYDL